MQRLKERLVFRRNALNLSQEALAAKSGVSPRAIASYEMGSMPTHSRLVMLAKALDVAPTWLMGAEESALRTEEHEGEGSYKAAEFSLQELPDNSLQQLFRSLGDDYKMAEGPARARILDLLDAVLADLKRREQAKAGPETTVILHEKRKPAPPSSPLTSEEAAAQKAFLDAIPDDVGGDRESQRSRGADEQHPRKGQPRKPSSSGSKPPPPDV